METDAVSPKGQKENIVNDRSLWQRMLDILEAGAAAVRRVLERHSGVDSVAFSIAFIALAAKQAKADGTVTRDEVRMFRKIFVIPPEEEQNAARVFNLCRQDLAGYEYYAKQLHNALGTADPECETRSAVLDGLFHIAMADGEYHPNEERFLRRVAEIFGLSDSVFIKLQSQHVPERRNPWVILGLAPGASTEALKQARRDFLKNNHPDRLMARGLPTEMIALAAARLATFNTAYDEVRGLARSNDRA